MGDTIVNFYIRRYRETDQEVVLRIWYKESLDSHSFIPAKFWADHLESLKQKYLPEAETFVAERDDQILGFISLMGNYIGALFVDKLSQGQGIGNELVAFALKLKGNLFVDVYKQNNMARDFYVKNGFDEKREKIQPETGHALITMYLDDKVREVHTQN